MTTMPTSGASRAGALYVKVQDGCRAAVRRGRIRRAAVLAGRGSRLARLSGETRLQHLAAVNEAMVALEAGEAEKAGQGLREVILASTDPEVSCRASFYMASALRRRNRLGRAVFYARRAADLAETAGDQPLRARCRNLLGNICLTQGDLQEAEEAYGEALSLWNDLSGDHRFARAIVLDNLGYCLTLQERLGEGIPHIQKALALALEVGDRRCQAECRQDLAHAFLVLRRVPTARLYAEAALEAAQAASYLDIVRNCSYLLGEMASLEGRQDEAEAHFQRLQELYPDVPFLRQFLHLFDVSSVLTLH